MTFGEKLKKLRTDNKLTQEQLAEKLYVKRTAVSKWETDNGYPSIDSLKALSDLFKVSIDDLISDEDVKNKKLLDEKRAKRFYFFAICFLALTVIFTLLAYFLKLKYISIGSVIGLVGYVAFAFLSKPSYKRLEMKKYIVPYIISRAIILAIVMSVVIYTIVTL